MSVYAIFKNDGSGHERFFGIFSDYDKAIELCKTCPGDFLQFEIRKIDLDKIYLTNVNDYDLVSSTAIGEHFMTLDFEENTADVSDDFTAHLHETNDFKNYQNDFKNTEEFIIQEEVQEDDVESLVSADSENFKVSPFVLFYNDVVQKNKEAIYSLWLSASSEFKKQYSV